VKSQLRQELLKGPHACNFISNCRDDPDRLLPGGWTVAIGSIEFIPESDPGTIRVT
jgi:hypothetical protein